MAIEVVNRQRLARIDRRGVAEVARAALAELRRLEKLPETESGLTVAFVRDARMRDLNRRFRGRDYATDVLSFPAADEAETGDPAAIENYLGDIVISTDVAARQAEAAGLSFEREVRELVLHGVLHLCGYDHETDDGQMNRLEMRLRKKLLK